MMKIKVGKYDVLTQARFLVAEGDDAHIDFSIDDTPARLRIRFATDDSDERKDQFGMFSEPDPDDEDRGLITLVNWNDGRQIGDPLPFLSRGEEEFYCVISACYAGDVYDVFLQVMREAPNE